MLHNSKVKEKKERKKENSYKRELLFSPKIKYTANYSREVNIATSEKKRKKERKKRSEEGGG